jgi:hypothetical protein
MRLLTVATIAILSLHVFGQALAAQSPAARHPHHRQAVRGGGGSAFQESHVGQASGKLGESGNGKLPPEGAALGATPDKKPAQSGSGATSAVRCSGTNSTSTECYTATQQMRPLAK